MIAKTMCPNSTTLAWAAAFAFALLAGQAVAQTTLAPVIVQERPADAVDAQPTGLLRDSLGKGWLEQPVSSSVIDQRLMRDTGSSRLTDVLRLDASVDPNYSVLGYYEGFQVRGFPVDPVLGMRVNGVPIVGEAPISMDNKRAVEVLHGPAGAWVGMGSGGGLINLVTKRPETIRELGFRAETPESGGATLDLGHADGQSGWRLNASADRYRPYARGANGDGQMVSLALDQALSGGHWLELDFEISRHSQITQPGSQLLGGTALPPINPETVLGLSSWSQPTVFESLFAMARLQRSLQSGWKMTATGSVHHVKTDDRSSFPWGCSAASTTALASNFCSDGNFTLYDYRSLNETRTVSSASAWFEKSLVWSQSRHDLGLGAEVLHRLTRMPSYVYDYADSSGSDTGNVYTGSWSGSGSSAAASDVFDQELLQTSLVGRDRISLAGGQVVSAQLRAVRHQEAFRSDFYPGYYNSIAWNTRSVYRLIPAVSLSLPLGSSGSAMGYLSYRQDLEAGAKAPLGATNNGSVLAPRLFESLELGLRRSLSQGLSLSSSLFHTWRPYNFRDDLSGLSGAAGDYVQRGTESRTGLEVSLAGRLAPRLRGQFAATAVDSTTSGTGNALFDGRQALNTPKFRATSFLAYRPPHWESLEVQGTWLYTGRRPASRDNSVYAPDFHRVDLGFAYSEKTKQGLNTYRLMVENVFDARYWRDVPEFLGDAYLIPGAPRVLKASVNMAF